MQSLPEPAICNIIKLARRRCIPGTNRYAKVCRLWRWASSYEEESEQLQLLLDLHNLQEAELKSCLAWIRQYGSCVTGLDVNGWRTPCWTIMEQLLVAPCSFGAHLSRLELDGEDTLQPLALHLQQLPLLQHLRASITYRGQQQGEQEDGAHLQQYDATPADLTQLCPQLVSLNLRVDTIHREWCFTPPPHAWLSCLLPKGLQQLELYGMTVDCAHLTQLTALQHLILGACGLRRPLELLGMSRLQEVELWQGGPVRTDPALLASKLVGLCCPHVYLPAATVRQLVNLTALTWRAPDGPDPAQAEAVPEVNLLLSLTSLRRLILVGSNSRVLEGLSSLSSLRSLEYRGDVGQEVLELVGQVTQLTSLQLSSTDVAHGLQGAKSQMVQQLTGLQHLTIDQTWVVACGRELVALEQLTQLVVMQSEGTPLLKPAALVVPLSSRPASLQHVVYRTMDPCRADDYPCDSRVEVVPSPLPGVRVTCAYCCKPLEQSLVRQCQLRPCPHLPGVMEVVSRG
jgi:hypothetical protein